MALINDLISSIQITLDSINKTVKKYQSNSKVSDRDRKLQIAINTAKEIVSTYDAVQRGIAVAQQNERERTGAVILRLKMTDDWESRHAHRPKYKYWTDFSPDVAIEVLRTLMKEGSWDRRQAAIDIQAIGLIQKLEVIVRPFRAHQPEQIQVRSLGLRPYKFNSYANWVQSFSDHQMSYALWRECGFE